MWRSIKNGHEYFTVRNESGRKYSVTGVRTTKIPSSDQNILPQIELRGIIINPSSEREIGTEQLFGRIEKLFNETEYISFMLFDYNLLMNSVRCGDHEV